MSWTRVHQGIAQKLNQTLGKNSRGRETPPDVGSSREDHERDESASIEISSDRARHVTVTTLLRRPKSDYPQAPLDTERAIRIVQLLPGYHWEEVRCKILVQNLQSDQGEDGDRTPFEALSYTWGSWEDSKTISFAGIERQFPVTNNLWLALKRLRFETEIRNIWIDQLSINQGDEDEKAKQVALMGTIYRQATSVIIWLGDIFDTESDSSGSEARQRAHLKQVLAATQPNWFTRLWVLQEFAVPEEPPTVCFGPHTLSWYDFTLLVLRNGSRKRILMSGPTMWPLIVQILTFASIREIPKPQSFLSLAWAVSQLQCVIPQDKVYGLLALLSHDIRTSICVDYRQSDVSVFCQATHAIIVHECNLLLFSFVFKTPQRALALPSWTIDFVELPTGLASDIKSNAFERWVRSACNNIMDTALPIDLQFQGERLAVLGRTPWPWLPRFRDWDFQHNIWYNSQALTLTFNALRFDRVGHLASLADLHSWAAYKDVYKLTKNLLFAKYRPCISEVAGAYARLSDRASSLPSSTTSCGTCHQKLDPFSIYTHIHAWELMTEDSITKHGDLGSWSFTSEVLALDGTHPRAFTTTSGLLGLGPLSLIYGATIVLSPGTRFPIAIMPTENGRWKLLGFVYIFGVMQGELMEKVPDLDLEMQSFTLE